MFNIHKRRRNINGNWSAKYMTNVKPHRTFVSINCGRNADNGMTAERELLMTYLKPLRDAQAQMKSERGSVGSNIK
ncbi:MAG: hypothetical protein ACLS8T_41075 [Anaerobutyricum sp.]